MVAMIFYSVPELYNVRGVIAQRSMKSSDVLGVAVHALRDEVDCRPMVYKSVAD